MHVMTLEVTEMFEDTKGLITSRISKDRQHNGKKKSTDNRYRETMFVTMLDTSATTIIKL